MRFKFLYIFLLNVTSFRVDEELYTGGKTEGQGGGRGGSHIVRPPASLAAALLRPPAVLSSSLSSSLSLSSSSDAASLSSVASLSSKAPRARLARALRLEVLGEVTFAVAAAAAGAAAALAVREGRVPRVRGGARRAVATRFPDRVDGRAGFEPSSTDIERLLAPDPSPRALRVRGLLDPFTFRDGDIFLRLLAFLVPPLVEEPFKGECRVDS